jgi:hypothetical protein
LGFPHPARSIPGNGVSEVGPPHKNLEILVICDFLVFVAAHDAGAGLWRDLIQDDETIDVYSACCQLLLD